MHEQWEYKVLHFDAQKWTWTDLPADTNERLGEYGAKGWELVSTESIQRPSGFGATTVGILAFFKRRIKV